MGRTDPSRGRAELKELNLPSEDGAPWSSHSASRVSEGELTEESFPGEPAPKRERKSSKQSETG